MTPPITLGLNLLWLRPGQVGGTEVAAIGALKALEARENEVDLHVYAQPSFAAAYPDLAAASALSMMSVPRDSRVARALLESTWLPTKALGHRLDVLHCLGGVTPVKVTTPTVLTLHDVQPLETAHRFTDSNFSDVKRRWLRSMIPRSIAEATLVIVPSAFSRERLVDLVDLEESKIVVVPHGGDVPIGADLVVEETRLREMFDLPGPFVVYPAITYAHKNHSILLEAFARVVTDRPDARLVLTGGVGPMEAAVRSRIERLGIGASVKRVGRVTAQELHGLLAFAAALVFPSRYEGFGLPIVEAFRFDTPVVAASAGSLPELVADAGVLIDPDDIDRWAEAIGNALDGAYRSVELSRRRSERARLFSWNRISSELVDVYRRVVEESQ